MSDDWQVVEEALGVTRDLSEYADAHGFQVAASEVHRLHENAHAAIARLREREAQLTASLEWRTTEFHSAVAHRRRVEARVGRLEEALETIKSDAAASWIADLAAAALAHEEEKTPIP